MRFVPKKILVRNDNVSTILSTIVAVVQENLPNFIEKDDWPANLPDLNPNENLWSIIDEAAYRDPNPKAMGGLNSRLRQAWRNIPLTISLSEPARSKRYTEEWGARWILIF